jgi:hypothetical protein
MEKKLPINCTPVVGFHGPKTSVACVLIDTSKLYSYSLHLYIRVPKLFYVASQRANVETKLTIHIMQWERQRESSI